LEHIFGRLININLVNL